MKTFEKLLTALAPLSNAPGSELDERVLGLLQLLGRHRLLDHATDLLEDLVHGRRRSHRCGRRTRSGTVPAARRNENCELAP